MNAPLRMELRRSLGGKPFIAAILIGTFLAIVSAIGPIVVYRNHALPMLSDEYLAYRNAYQFAYTSAWSAWMPMRASDPASNLFFFISPLLIALAYSWSYRSEQLGGYAQTVILRIGRMHYYVAKTIATFISGGLVATIPLLVNFISLATFIPLQMPDIIFKVYTGVSTNMAFSSLFFNNPVLYMWLRFGINFLLGGLWATSVLSISLFIHNRAAIVAIPYIVLLIIKYCSEKLYLLLGCFGHNLTPIDHLRAFGDLFTYSEYSLLGDILLLFIVTITIPLLSRKRDIL